MTIQDYDNYMLVRYEDSRFDSRTAPVFRKTMNARIGKKIAPPKAVILDLHGVNFIDLSGLGAILSVMQPVQKKTKLLLCGAEENVRNIFSVTHLDSIFKMYQNAEEAAKAVPMTVN
ncbi:STAS domain-containing protein [Candidatus Electronema sp. PJ]|uniref:STAS domain-containing protein n=1 Tax=Candidatus Electronema sp. PJ TaxID=3401572 RepID=UPI003AA80151